MIGFQVVPGFVFLQTGMQYIQKLNRCKTTAFLASLLIESVDIDIWKFRVNFVY
jgi:hypothetical protein